MLPMFCGCYVTTVVMVADVGSVALILLVTKLADIPVFVLVAIITKDINIHWLLRLCEHTRSIFICGYFLSFYLFDLREWKGCFDFQIVFQT
jgi:hypothetical protein